MTDPKVIEYIKSETAKGTSRDEIIKNLMSGGGWTLPDIQAHFIFIEQNQGAIPGNPIQNPQIGIMGNTPTQPKKRMNVFGANFLIFIGYYLFGIFVTGVLGEDSFGYVFFFYGYLIHAAILILTSVTKGIQGISYKVKTNAWHYFLAAILLLIVGFGACTAAFMGLNGTL